MKALYIAIFTFFLISFSNLSFSAIKTTEMHDLKPYSLTLNEDVQNCKTKGCKPIIGITFNTLQIEDLNEKLDIDLNFENCSMHFSAWKYRLKEDTLIITDGDNTPVKINCDGNVSTYNKVSFLQRNGQYGIVLRKIEGVYTHLGKLSIGIMFLPIK